MNLIMPIVTPKHRSYYITGMLRGLIEVLTLNGLAPFPKIQALSMLLIQVLAAVPVWSFVPYTLLAQSRVELVTRTAGVALFVVVLGHTFNR